MVVNQALKTYRYLRLGMVAIIALLGVGMGLEWLQTPARCLQPSLSAFYYTPVQPLLTGALTAVGLCLIVLKGNSAWEDVALNIAGMLLPVVAFVPIRDVGHCRSAPLDIADPTPNSVNNVTALLIIGAAAWVVAVWLGLRADHGRLTRADLTGLAASALIVIGMGVWFWVGQRSFLVAAHYVAAATSFGCFTAVVVLNASAAPRRTVSAAYLWIAAIMVATAGAFPVLWWVVRWTHAILFVEVVLVICFAAFWLVQTRELWHVGLRPVLSRRRDNRLLAPPQPPTSGVRDRRDR